MKKKNSCIALALFLASVHSFASLMSMIPQEKVPQYAQAVKLALMAQRPLRCDIVGWKAGSLANEFDSMDSGEIDDQGAQPLLILIQGDQQTGQRYVYTVTTSADYKSVISIRYEEQNYTHSITNEGTIENPSIVNHDEWKTITSALCE